jgi:hypothetical protein
VTPRLLAAARIAIAPPWVVRFPVTATSPAATTELAGSDAVSTTLPFSNLMPVAFASPMPPVSRSGKDAIGNVELGLLVSKGSISKLSRLPDWLRRSKFVPGTDARII